MSLIQRVRKAILVSSLILVAVSAWAQMGGAPGAEVKKLDYFVGTWNAEGAIAQGPWGAGGKFTSTGTTEWMPGGFFLVRHSDVTMPSELGGAGKETAIVGYDSDQNVYTNDTFNSQGRHTVSKGTVSGDTWTWTSTANYGGQDIKHKMTIKTLSPTSYTLKVEISIDGTNWITFMDVKATKK
ncbi:MAG TPA: DUF1579 family protein [Candidatus Sulfotelmatobacter sp.]|jgi:hypothetical protein